MLIVDNFIFPVMNTGSRDQTVYLYMNYAKHHACIKIYKKSTRMLIQKSQLKIQNQLSNSVIHGDD